MERVWDWFRKNEMGLVSIIILLESVAIFAFSVVPFAPLSAGVGNVFRTGDLEHFLAYFVYGGLLAWASHCRGRGYWVVLAIGSLFGLLNESVQLFVPGRLFDSLDVVVDVFGVGLGALLVTRFKIRWFR